MAGDQVLGSELFAPSRYTAGTRRSPAFEDRTDDDRSFRNRAEGAGGEARGAAAGDAVDGDVKNAALHALADALLAREKDILAANARTTSAGEGDGLTTDARPPDAHARSASRRSRATCGTWPRCPTPSAR